MCYGAARSDHILVILILTAIFVFLLVTLIEGHSCIRLARKGIWLKLRFAV